MEIDGAIQTLGGAGGGVDVEGKGSEVDEQRIRESFSLLRHVAALLEAVEAGECSNAGATLGMGEWSGVESAIEAYRSAVADARDLLTRELPHSALTRSQHEAILAKREKVLARTTYVPTLLPSRRSRATLSRVSLSRLSLSLARSHLSLSLSHIARVSLSSLTSLSLSLVSRLSSLVSRLSSLSSLSSLVSLSLSLVSLSLSRLCRFSRVSRSLSFAYRHGH